jgi:hypothetical protein
VVYGNGRPEEPRIVEVHPMTVQLLHPPKTYASWRARLDSYLVRRIAVGLDELDIDVQGYWDDGFSAGEAARDILSDLMIDMTPTGEAPCA